MSRDEGSIVILRPLKREKKKKGFIAVGFDELSFSFPSDVEAGQLPILRNNVTQHCCSGFCIDLLEKFRVDLGFTYELNRVDDPKFGTLNPLVRWIPGQDRLSLD